MQELLAVDISNHEVCEGTELPTDCSLMEIIFWRYTVVPTNVLVGEY